jgi:hypothetical protein
LSLILKLSPLLISTYSDKSKSLAADTDAFTLPSTIESGEKSGMFRDDIVDLVLLISISVLVLGL